MKNKGLFYLVLVITLIHFHLSMATPWKEINSISSEVESEFLFGSHVARMLYDVSQSVSGQTGNSNNQAVDCPQSNGYRSCLPSQNGSSLIPRLSCGTSTPCLRVSVVTCVVAVVLLCIICEALLLNVDKNNAIGDGKGL
ncbi:hypothetical protein ACSQ67_008397 [Phaseolus vulgaris]